MDIASACSVQRDTVSAVKAFDLEVVYLCEAQDIRHAGNGA
jgi:hypothetical protein